MTLRSIRLRLLVAAALSVVLALAIAGAGLTYLFERHVERRIEAEIAARLNQLIGGITVDKAGTVAVAEPGDPRFAVPFSGLYWQVEKASARQIVRSRSLWDIVLPFPSDPHGTVTEIAGPRKTTLLAAARAITLSGPEGDVPIRALVALDHAEVTRATNDFAYDLIPSLGMLALILIAAAWLQVTVGLAPLERLRRAVAGVISGRSARLATDVPDEVTPLVAEINRLLAAQELALTRARTRAADLAHGLKTPLQVLSGDVRTLREKGESQIADEIERIAATIARHVDRELARARLGVAMAPATPIEVRKVAERVVAVLERTPRGRSLMFTIDIAENMRLGIDESDLAEILGNLGENACRFARNAIRIDGGENDDGLFVAVTDDGPGIPEARTKEALTRGGRLDEHSQGDGLGLAIVADTVEAYGGQLRLEDAGPGLRAIIVFPGARKVSGKAA
jgi:signal transduction histidine kinase